MNMRISFEPLSFQLMKCCDESLAVLSSPFQVQRGPDGAVPLYPGGESSSQTCHRILLWQ